MATGSILKILRSLTLGNRPSGRAYGEPYVNLAENQLGVVNSTGGNQDLLGVTIFSPNATYIAGQVVNHSGLLYAAQTNITTPAAWNASQWSQLASLANIPATPPTSVPSGSVMVFWQSAAPTGWTQVTTQNDKLLRIVSGTGGVSGGTNAFSTINAQTTVGNHTIALSELPTIASSGSNSITVYPSGNSNMIFPTSNAPSYGFTGVLATGSGGSYYCVGVYNANPISYTGGSSTTQNISVSSGSTTGGAHNHPITLSIQYIDLILASKN